LPGPHPISVPHVEIAGDLHPVDADKADDLLVLDNALALFLDDLDHHAIVRGNELPIAE
jgi:hypothetical protein